MSKAHGDHKSFSACCKDGLIKLNPPTTLISFLQKLSAKTEWGVSQHCPACMCRVHWRNMLESSVWSIMGVNKGGMDGSMQLKMIGPSPDIHGDIGASIIVHSRRRCSWQETVIVFSENQDYPGNQKLSTLQIQFLYTKEKIILSNMTFFCKLNYTTVMNCCVI